MNKPSDDEWMNIPQIERKRIYKMIRRKINRPAIPLAFAILASLLMFAILPHLPLHPLSIPVAYGGGLSIGLILWVVM